MKKFLLVLLAFLIIPFSNAHAIMARPRPINNALLASNEDERNIMIMINQVRALYISIVDFRNLEQIGAKNVLLTSTQTVSENDLKRFQLGTEDNNTVAVVKYKTQNCDNLKNVREKLIQYNLITDSENTICENNSFIARLKKR